MTPFGAPLAAIYLGDDRDLSEPVALIALNEHEYLAIDSRGAPLIDVHANFAVVDRTVTGAIWEAETADGS